MTRQPSTTVATRGTTMTPRRIAALVILGIFVIFTLQNRDSTAVELFMLELTGPLWLMLLVSFVLGGAVAWLLTDRRLRS